MSIAPSHSSTSASLICRVQAHDADSWQRLVRLYTPTIYAWARRNGLQESDAGDLVQEVFCGVLNSIQRFQMQPGIPRFRAWLFGITRHKLTDYFREPERAHRTVDFANMEAQLDRLEEEIAGQSTLELVNLAHRALAILETDFQPQTWQAFWRTAIDGVPAREVSEELKMSVGAVYTARSRVLAHLRKELEGLI